MPPRYVYWTILIDDKPTAFRAREAEDLLPTLRQLQRTSPNAEMRYFARGRLWKSRDEAQTAVRRGGVQLREAGWRPGGQHRDPRARFKPKRGRFRKRRKPTP